MSRDLLTNEKKFRSNIDFLISKLEEKADQYKNNDQYKQYMLQFNVAKVFISGMDDHTLIKFFINQNFDTNYCFETSFWKKIKERDNSVFSKSKDKLAANFNLSFMDNVLNNKNKLSSFVSDDEKETFWRVVNGMVKVSIKYVLENNLKYRDIDRYCELYQV